MSEGKTHILKIAPPYDDDLVRRIEQGFSKKLGYDVRFEVTEDHTLLCGFIAFVSGTVYDVSGKTQMLDIKEHLIDLVIVPPSTSKAEEDIL